MKTLRLWLLVLLAILLPIRGAAAAAMLCPPVGSAGQTQGALAEHHPAAAAERVIDPDMDQAAELALDLHQHGPAQHRQAQPGHHDHQRPSGAPDACNLCAALCSVTPMLSSPPTLDMPPQVSTVFSPELAAQPPSFVSGGQDRPPRTC